MKQLTILLIFIFSGYTFLSAQDELPKPKRWSFSLSGGAAIPTEAYGKNNAADAAIYRKDIPTPTFIIGFDKAKSGFAKVGYYYNAELQFKFNSGIAVFLRSGRLTNSVQTAVLSDFLTDLNGGDVEVEHVDYNVFYVTPGIRYAKQFNNFDIGMSVFTGYANCNYPYYKAILLFTTTNPPRFWAHEGEQPNLKALNIGSLLNFDYNVTSKFVMGLEFVYQKAGFKYEMSTRAIPGGTQNPTIEDTIKLNVINIGLKIGYKLF